MKSCQQQQKFQINRYSQLTIERKKNLIYKEMPITLQPKFEMTAAPPPSISAKGSIYSTFYHRRVRISSPDPLKDTINILRRTRFVHSSIEQTQDSVICFSIFIYYFFSHFFFLLFFLASKSWNPLSAHEKCIVSKLKTFSFFSCWNIFQVRLGVT